MSLKPTYMVYAYKNRILSETESIDAEIQKRGISEKDFCVTICQADYPKRHYYFSIYVIRDSLEAAKPIVEKLGMILSELGYKTGQGKTALVWDEGYICVPIR